MAVNPRLDEAPELVNQAPYGDGWMIAVEAPDAGDWQALLDAGDYQATLT